MYRILFSLWYGPKGYFVYEAKAALDFVLRESYIYYVVLSTSVTNHYKQGSAKRKPGEFKTVTAANVSVFWFFFFFFALFIYCLYHRQAMGKQSLFFC